MISGSLFALLLAPAAAVAQEHHEEHQEHMEAMHHEHGVGIASSVPHYERFRDWIVASAELMPEEHYGYQPSAEVRTFGQLIGHLANAQYLFCSNAMGEESPNSMNFENESSRDALIAAVRTAMEYCDRAYAMSESKAMEETTFFGQEGSRLWVLNFNAVHNAEHYGNLVTYMRIKGLVPPSSAGN
jgi:uncharacterized damage-inducible protein DinB